MLAIQDILFNQKNQLIVIKPTWESTPHTFAMENLVKGALPLLLRSFVGPNSFTTDPN